MNRIDTLEPEFKLKIQDLIDELAAVTGLKWVIVQARRTMAEQQALYDQGRTQPGKVVTNARPGQSAHNFGLAADLCPINPATGDCWWDAPQMTWRKLAETAHEMGLVSGFFFKSIFDAPHVEAPDWRDRQEAWKRGEITIE
jgi:peptidoglycan L-alanyl-D-glutamate endopeptidase CwlK